MKVNSNAGEISMEQAEQVTGGAYSPGMYQEASMKFLKERLGEEIFNRVMGNENSRKHPYVAARVFLSQADWDKFVWIERNGSLEGF